MSRPPVVLAVLLVLACKRAEAPASTTAPPPQPVAPTTAAAAPAPAPAAPAANPSEKAWKVKPTPLSVIKADPPSYLDKPTLVFVAVKPTDYFNYGYNGARNSHFAFEIRPALENGHVGPEKLFGYASRSWARPFFEGVNKQLDASKKGYAAATLVVAYSKKRYDGQSADHVEILAADVGEKLDMDPASVVAQRGNSIGPVAQTGSKPTSEGDCEIWRRLRRAGKLSLPPPRYCRTFHAGDADRVFTYAHQNGHSTGFSLCVAWRGENRMRRDASSDQAWTIVSESCAVDEDAGQVQEGLFPE